MRHVLSHIRAGRGTAACTIGLAVGRGDLESAAHTLGDLAYADSLRALRALAYTGPISKEEWDQLDAFLQFIPFEEPPRTVHEHHES